MRGWLGGLLAGAAGTVALNVSTYLDMALRGRPASTVPAKVAGRLGTAVGLEPLADRGEAEDDAVGNRRSGVGALLGYATGLGLGLGYGALIERLDRRPTPLPIAGLALGTAAMAASDLPAVTTGATDPRQWGVSGWLADIVPHLAYGLVTAAAFDALHRGRPTGRWLLGLR